MNLLGLLLGWLIARTVRVVPIGVPSGAAAPSPTPGPTPPRRRHPTTPTTPRGSTAPTAPVSTSRTTVVPWPQVVPAGLPAFPSSAWVPDQPPPPAVIDRASQLLPILWGRGVGTFKTEKIAGRWITFRAVDMGGKKGVVAYRLAEPTAVPSIATPAAAASSSPTMLATHQSSSSSPVALPLLKRGSKGESVKVLQRRLNIEDDGDFGSGTEAAVRHYQAQHGLTVDGKVGNETWTSLLGRAA